MSRAGFLLAALAMFVPLLAAAQPSPNSGAGKLAALRGKSRSLLLFYPQPRGVRPLEPVLQKQIDLLKGHESALQERQVVLVFVPEQETPEAVSAGAWSSLRRQFGVNGGVFTAILLGKDGGEKFRSHTPVTIERLNALIDAMPMRQQEIRNGNSK